MELREGDPTQIGGYAVLERLGIGGMGTVFLGRAESGRLVAVKVVHQQYASDAEFRTRFRQEVAAARQVSGAFTAPVIDADPEADQPWMATTYIDGQTLRARVREEGPLTGGRLRTVVVGLVEALVELHTVGVIHRDLKPDNVLLTDDGPRVIDFGISRVPDQQTMTVTGRVLGTPPYMSPEQLSAAHRVTPASDIFSLGAVLVYAATGHGPFDAEHPYMSAYRVTHEPPDLATLSGTVREIAQWCLFKDPTERPRPHELLKAFRSAPTSDWGPRPHTDRAPDCTPSTQPTRPAWATKRRLQVTTAIVAALAATAWGTTALFHLAQGQEPPRADTTKPMVEPSAELAPVGWAQWEANPHLEVRNCFISQYALLCRKRVSPFTMEAFDLDSGKSLWKKMPTRHDESDLLGISEAGHLGFYDGPVNGPPQLHGDPESLHITAIKVTTGDKVWSTAPGTTTNGALLLPGAVVGQGLSKGDSIPTQAWNPQDGTLLWEKQLPRDMNLEAISGHLYLESGSRKNKITEIDGRTGRELWSRTVEAGRVEYGGSDFALVRPMDDPDQQHNMLLLNPHSKEVKNTKLPALAHYTAHDGVVYGVTADGVVVTADSRTGKIKWTTSTHTETDESRPLAVGDRLYFATTDARILCLSTKNGNIIWKSASRRKPHRSLDPEATALIGVMHQKVFALSQRQTIFALRAPVKDAKPPA